MYSKEDILAAPKTGSKKEKAIHAKAIKDYGETHNKQDLAFSSSNIYIWQSLIKDVEVTDDSAPPCKFELSYGTFTETARKCSTGDAVCIMCFCDYMTAGGEFIGGGDKTEEERLCLESNLYAIQASENTQKRFYSQNQTAASRRNYGPRLLYIPDVVIYGSPKDRYSDVLLYNVPFDSAKKQKWEESGKKRSGIRAECMTADLRSALWHRLDAIISVAAQQQPDVLICGGFGCDENGNDLWSSFSAFKDLVDNKYSRTFKKVVVVMQNGADYLYLANKMQKENKNADKPHMQSTPETEESEED